MACTIESLSHPTHTYERCSGTYAEREHTTVPFTRKETRKRHGHESGPTLVTSRQTPGLARLGSISTFFAQGHKAAAELCQDSCYHAHDPPGITFSPSFWMMHVVIQHHCCRGGFAAQDLHPQWSPWQFLLVREREETPSSTTAILAHSIHLQTQRTSKGPPSWIRKCTYMPIPRSRSIRSSIGSTRVEFVRCEPFVHHHSTLLLLLVHVFPSNWQTIRLHPRSFLITNGTVSLEESKPRPNARFHVRCAPSSCARTLLPRFTTLFFSRSVFASQPARTRPLAAFSVSHLCSL